MQALATRCPDCGTSFRVQEAQLAASQGFVRCGRCDAVFDARQSLFDLNDGQPVVSATPTAEASQSSPDHAHNDAALAAPPAETVDTTGGPAESAFPSTQPPSHAEPAWIETTTPSATDRPEPAWQDPAWGEPPAAPGAFEASLPPELVNERMRALLGSNPSAEAPASPPAWASLADAPVTSTKRPGVLAAGWIAVALLALALPLQWAWTERAALRARSPGLDQVWRQACPTCPAPAWAQLDGLSVGASSLQPTPQGQAYQLQLTLHNRSAFPLAMPWLDLRLQDAQGRVVVRRSVSPTELGASSDRLAAGAQMRLQGTFRLKPAARSTDASAISGYEIGLFHP